VEDRSVRFADVLRFALTAFHQQKVRTVLTTLGVVCGTFVLTLSLSIGLGVSEATMRQFRRFDQLRRIEVWSSWQTPEAKIPKEELQVRGKMSDAKRQRIREAKIRHWQRKNARGPQVALTRERLRDLRNLDHVASVVPSISLSGQAVYRDLSEQVTGLGVAPDNRAFRRRLVAGEFFTSGSTRSVLVTEYLLFLWGVVDDEEVQRIPGQKMRLEFRFGGRPPWLLLNLLGAGSITPTPEQEKVLRKAIGQLPDALPKLNLEAKEKDILKKILAQPRPEQGPVQEKVQVEEFTIAGVLRMPGKEDLLDRWEGWAGDVDLVFPFETAESLFFQVVSSPDQGLDRAVVMVDDEANVEEVAEKISGLGFQTFSLVEVVEKVRLNVLLMSFAMGFVAAVALLVADVGIINTMLMTVLERTHEIGVMKAVGARDRHIQLIFLVEGALIGLAGGALGLLFGWLVSIPCNSYAQELMEKQTNSKIEESLFAFPLWLTVGMPLFAAMVSMLAAAYPARRAARVSPITALRHE
jgi:putative ABC transport system permease protein